MGEHPVRIYRERFLENRLGFFIIFFQAKAVAKVVEIGRVARFLDESLLVILDGLGVVFFYLVDIADVVKRFRVIICFLD